MGSKRRLQLKLAGALAAGLLLVGLGMVQLMRMFSGTPEVPREVIRQITLVQPPPPPPPPPLVEPPSEPEVEEVVVEDEPPMPETAADQAPPGADLGVDAAGVAGGDSFGLVGKKGGRALLGGGEGSVFGWYAGQLKRAFESALADNDELRTTEYSVVLHIWVDGQGRVTRVRLAGSTGKPPLDRAIEIALAEVRGTSEVPPPDLPQPVKLRLRSRF